MVFIFQQSHAAIRGVEVDVQSFKNRLEFRLNLYNGGFDSKLTLDQKLYDAIAEWIRSNVGPAKTQVVDTVGLKDHLDALFVGQRWYRTAREYVRLSIDEAARQSPPKKEADQKTQRI